MLRIFACLLILFIFTSNYNQLSAQPAKDSFSTYSQVIPGSEIQFKMMPVRGGSFKMGSDAGEKGRKPDEGPAKQISVSSFWIGAYEVSYDEYDAFFKDETFSRNQPAAD